MPSQPSVSLGGRLRGAQVGSSRVPLPDLCRFGGWGRSLSFGADTLACRRLWVRVPSSASQNPLETAGFSVLRRDSRQGEGLKTQLLVSLRALLRGAGGA